VTLPYSNRQRKEIVLGRWGAEDIKVEYDRALSEWIARRRCPPAPSVGPGLTINEMLLAYLRHAEQYYRYADGTNTNELNDIKLSLCPMCELYGHTEAAAFGPIALKAVQNYLIRKPIVRKVKVVDAETGKATWHEKIIKNGLARGVINQRIGKIVRAFRWAVSEEMLPETVCRALEKVDGLQRGRSEARETEPIKPVSLALVEDTLPHLTPTVADMIRLQMLTGARSGEICIMRTCDIDMSGAVWIYRPCRHKTEHRGKVRNIAIGPQGQEIIRRYLKPNVELFLFSPAEAREKHFKELREARKAPVQPSQICRKKKRPRRVPGERYTPNALAHAVRRACERNGLEHWHPHQIRHAHATEVRRRFGLEHAQAALGHAQAKVTELYAELDLRKAVLVAAAIG
jgi:integrase